jgi:5'-3' exoribonuclease 2
MGVPAFYRWLSEKYSKIVVDVVEQRSHKIDGIQIPVDLRLPNPNGVEFDNLYVDMNGLIHPCSHPEDREAPTTEEEMYINITYYVDRLVAAVRPRNLLFLAIDGVAPRAKMNQQRSRRFRSAQEAEEKRKLKRQVLDEMASLGYEVSHEKEKISSEWDSNVITPGTDFMFKLSDVLRFYLLYKMNHDPYWKSIKVIVSDASVPGEGEHKIMDFIRCERTQPFYNPNLHHVIHGLDADLIMLALATHEPHFTILREKVFFGKNDRDSVKSDAMKLRESQTLGSNFGDGETNWVYNKPLQALHISVLREYLENEYNFLRGQLLFGFDFERIIDDFIFLCFFVGNDFLPHLPSLDIRDGALDFLIQVYKDVLPSLGDYVTSSGGNLNLLQAAIILSKVGDIEGNIFERRKVAEDMNEKRYKDRRQNPIPGRNQWEDREVVIPGGKVRDENHIAWKAVKSPVVPVDMVLGENQVAANKIKSTMLKKRRADVLIEAVDEPAVTSVWDSEEDAALEEIVSLPLINVAMGSGNASHDLLLQTKEELKRRIKSKENEMTDSYKVSVRDSVKFHEVGWRERYYNDPFKKKDLEAGGGLEKMIYTYVQGLCWVLKYYFEGVPSWNWFYPFHYAPFACDLIHMDSLPAIEFQKSKPFSPIEQLLAVLPSSSSHALPTECRWLMEDSNSPIIDLYNDDVPVDPNGKHLPWLWVLLLPFIDEKRISKAFELCEPLLSAESQVKNLVGNPVVFVDSSLPTCWVASSDSAVSSSSAAPSAFRDFVPSSLSSGHVDFNDGKLSGSLAAAPLSWGCDLHCRVVPPVGTNRWFSQINNNVVSVFQYSLPQNNGKHESVLLPGVRLKDVVLNPTDLYPKRPPRLNRSGFNILDLLSNERRHLKFKDQSSSRSSTFDSMMSRPGGPNEYRTYTPVDFNNSSSYGNLGYSFAGFGSHGCNNSMHSFKTSSVATPRTGYSNSSVRSSGSNGQKSVPFGHSPFQGSRFDSRLQAAESSQRWSPAFPNSLNTQTNYNSAVQAPLYPVANASHHRIENLNSRPRGEPPRVAARSSKAVFINQFPSSGSIGFNPGPPPLPQDALPSSSNMDSMRNQLLQTLGRQSAKRKFE